MLALDNPYDGQISPGLTISSFTSARASDSLCISSNVIQIGNQCRSCLCFLSLSVQPERPRQNSDGVRFLIRFLGGVCVIKETPRAMRKGSHLATPVASQLWALERGLCRQLGTTQPVVRPMVAGRRRRAGFWSRQRNQECGRAYRSLLR
jgi:hypothetical protein